MPYIVFLDTAYDFGEATLFISRMVIQSLMRLKNVSSSQLLMDNRESVKAGGDAQKDGGPDNGKRRKS